MSCPFEIFENVEGGVKDMVYVGPKMYCIPKHYKTEWQNFYNFKVRPDDVWINGFPRSGTTMTEELVWLLCNNLDYKMSKNILLQKRVKLLESNIIPHPSYTSHLNYQQLTDCSNRRFIKSHLPLSLLPPNLVQSGCKILYIARNPKDVIVSMYNLIDLMLYKGFHLSFKEYAEKFISDNVLYGALLEHVLEGWNVRNNKNVMFLFYEDLNKDLRNTIKKITIFLEKTLTESELNELMQHMNIDSFKKNASVNHEYLKTGVDINRNRKVDFIRNGKVGGWRDHFEKELSDKVDEWIARKLKNTNFRYPE